jgi:hypothetical protein
MFLTVNMSMGTIVNLMRVAQKIVRDHQQDLPT